jgi:hypothetical protein
MIKSVHLNMASLLFTTQVIPSNQIFVGLIHICDVICLNALAVLSFRTFLFIGYYKARKISWNLDKWLKTSRTHRFPTFPVELTQQQQQQTAATSTNNPLRMSSGVPELTQTEDRSDPALSGERKCPYQSPAHSKEKLTFKTYLVPSTTRSKLRNRFSIPSHAEVLKETVQTK